MKRLGVEIDRLIVDAVAIAPLRGEQFGRLVEQALHQRLNNGADGWAAGRENVTVTIPPTPGRVDGVGLAGHVAQAIHQSLTRKVSK